MATIARTLEALPIIRAGRNKKNLGASLGNATRKFRKFYVIADQNGYFAVGNMEHPETIAMIRLPFFLFPAGAMNFVLRVNLSAGRE